jgi:hypothetical protein
VHAAREAAYSVLRWGHAMIELRPRENGDFDELFARNARIHVETMNTNCVWLCVEADGKRIDLWIRAKGKLSYYTEESKP